MLGMRKYPITAKADIYPFALTLHEMMSLKPPHFGTAEDFVNSMNDSSSDSLNPTGDKVSSPADDEDAFDKELSKLLGEDLLLLSIIIIIVC